MQIAKVLFPFVLGFCLSGILMWLISGPVRDHRVTEYDLVPGHALQRLPGVVDEPAMVTSADGKQKRKLTRAVVIGRDLYNEVTYDYTNHHLDGEWNGAKVPFCRFSPAGKYPPMRGRKMEETHPDMRVCLPSWIIIGALKGGTSSLYTYLANHPAVTPARKKEVCTLRNWFKVTDIEKEYLTQFRGKPISQLKSEDEVVYTGEGCPFYLPDSRLLAPSLNALLPEVRLIMILRDPVDRLLSMFNMRVRYKNDGFKGNERLEDFVKCAPDRLYGHTICGSDHQGTRNFLHEGRYVLHLDGWFSVVPDSPQYMIIKSEDFYADEQGYMNEVFRHLGLPDYTLPPTVLAPKNAAPKTKKYDMDPQLRRDLHAFYEPYNHLLYKLIDTDFAWDGGLPKVRELLDNRPDIVLDRLAPLSVSPAGADAGK